MGQKTIEETIGESTRLFRPPYGSITLKSLAAIKPLGLRPWLWSVDPGDWRAGATTEGLLDSLSHTQAGDVVLLHDGCGDGGPGIATDRYATIDLIEPLAANLKARGLSFVTLGGIAR
jgi:peptidoglycan/xylan/chitin deacetylase (PgdA/CDA1 family)